MIVYSCSDLIFATKIHSTAQALGIVSRPARDQAALGNRLDRVDDGKPNDTVRAVLVDVTMGDAAMGLIEQASRHETTPVVVAFGPHVQEQLLETAKQRGAHRVMHRGAFSAQLPELLIELSGQTAAHHGHDD